VHRNEELIGYNSTRKHKLNHATEAMKNMYKEVEKYGVN
jgi:hypothetical protein